jgi:DNA primase
MTDIELVKSKLDIVDVISSYVPSVKRAGANFKGLCPFHNEKTSSFMINPSLQIFKCFGCGKAGDVIKFIEEIERVEFPEALRISAERAGIELKGGSMKKDEKLEKEKKRLIEANTLTAKFYNYILKTHDAGKEGRDYAQKRGIDSERITDFLVGFAPNQQVALKKFLLSKDFNEKELIKFGLLVERNGRVIDKFRNRLMQTIFNVKGEVVGFSGRYIGTSKEAPKYLNSPETLVYKKNELLYGLYNGKEALRSQKFAIMVEGNIDILSSHRVGVKNIIAPLGTAFTLNQAKLLKRFVDEVYFCFDTDEAGLKALIRGVEIIEQAGLTHKVIDINPYQDADELIIKAPGEWSKRVEEAGNTFEYLIKKLSEGLDLGRSDGKSKFEKRFMPILMSIKDTVTKYHFAKEVSIMLEVPENVILEKIDTKKFTAKEQSEPVFLLKKSSKNDELESYLLSIITQLDPPIKQTVIPEYFQNDLNKKIFVYIKENSIKDFKKLESELNDVEKEKFESILMKDLSSIKDVQKELKSIIDRLKKGYLELEAMKLRHKLKTDPDSDKYIEELNLIIKQLS